MARRWLLSAAEWGRLLAPPTDERDMLRHCALDPEDLAVIRSRRTDATRLGFALQLLVLRHPGRVLGPRERLPPSLVAFVARQLGVEADSLHEYHRRDATRRQHLVELMGLLGCRSFGQAAFQDLVLFLTPPAQLDPRPARLVAMALERLRRHRILLPAPSAIERAVYQARLRAERVSHDAVGAQLTGEHRQALDGLLRHRPDGPLTWLAWLRGASQSPAARNILALIERVRVLRRLDLARDLGSAVPGAVLERLAEEGLRMTPQHLGQLAPARRHAVLAATAVRLEEQLTDATLGMADKLMGSLARGAERRTEQKALRSLRDLHAHLRVLAEAGQAVIAARNERRDPVAAIEQRMAWPRFVRHVAQAEALARPEATDGKAELLGRYATVRSFAPALLDTFGFQGARSVASLLGAVELVRDTWRSGRRTLPADAPIAFVRRSWRPFVFRDGVLDRRAYELCVLSELRDRLRAGDVWVEGSRHYQAFDAALIPQPSFERLKAEGPLPVAVAPVCTDHLMGRRQLLEDELSTVAALARAGMLPDASLEGGELTISPLRAATPPEAEAMRQAAYDLLPRVRITDLLIEVDAWTGFSDCFAHQRSGRPTEDRPVLLAAILADGINLGLTRMAETCQGMTLRQLAWVHDWHVREEGYTAALVRLIEAHRALPLARAWGDGTTSSSDGQYFRAGGRGSGLGDINARHGNEPGVAF